MSSRNQVLWFYATSVVSLFTAFVVGAVLTTVLMAITSPSAAEVGQISIFELLAYLSLVAAPFCHLLWGSIMSDGLRAQFVYYLFPTLVITGAVSILSGITSGMSELGVVAFLLSYFVYASFGRARRLLIAPAVAFAATLVITEGVGSTWTLVAWGLVALSGATYLIPLARVVSHGGNDD